MALIRTAFESDAAAVAHVHVESWRTTYAGIVPQDYLAGLDESQRAQRWREILSQDSETLVAELDGHVAGFINGGPIREPVENCDAELYAIYLLSHAQGQGIGAELLRELAAALIDRGFRSMAVWVLDRNPSKHFYLKTGAHLVASKEIEIAGVNLKELAYCWPDLSVIRVPT